jgi:DNA-binding NarL/FixJ family response regulator
MRTVAIVETDPIMALLLREICRTAGYEVVGSARDAYSAKSMIERARPDFLLLEFRLGESGNGLDLIERVEQSCPWLFTIMITAWDINDIAGRMHGVQPDRIMRKPVHADTLIKVMAGAHVTRKANIDTSLYTNL